MKKGNKTIIKIVLVVGMVFLSSEPPPARQERLIDNQGRTTAQA